MCKKANSIESRRRKQSRRLWSAATALVWLIAASTAWAEDASRVAVPDRAATTLPVSPASPGVVRLRAPGIEADVELPAALGGRYEGVRFDRAGMVTEVRAAGHRFFGEWKPSRTGPVHDDVVGPADEFGMEQPWGYDEQDGAAGDADDTFVKIGVGRLRMPAKKPAEAPATRPAPLKRPPYAFYGDYEVVDAGRWTVTAPPDGRTLEFRHVVDADEAGLRGYEYVKRLRLVPGNPASLVVERTLTNSGSVALRSDHYTHNFVQIDGAPAGPDYAVELAIPVEAEKPEPLNNLVVIKGRTLTFPSLFPPNRTAWSPLRPVEARANSATGPAGGTEAADLDKTADAGGAWPSGELYSITNRHTGGRITIAQDLSPSRLVLYATGQAICVEPFVNVDVAPGGAVTWTTTYTFAGTPGR